MKIEYIFAELTANTGRIVDARFPYIVGETKRKLLLPVGENLEKAKKAANIPENAYCVSSKLIME